MKKHINKLMKSIKEHLRTPKEIIIDGKKRLSFPMQDNKMEPLIPEGESLIFNPYENKIEDGEIYLILISGFFKIRKLRVTEHIFLKRFKRKSIEITILNPLIKYEPVVLPIKDIKVFGKLCDRLGL